VGKVDRNDLVEYILRVIESCRTVGSKQINPFDLDVIYAFNRLHKYLPKLKGRTEQLLDSEAVKELSNVVKLQGDWIRNRASSGYIDPLLIELKIRSMDLNSLSDVFLRSWHPIVELEQLTPKRLKEGMDYWNSLPSLKDRSESLGGLPLARQETISKEDLVGMNLLSSKEFTQILEDLWREALSSPQNENGLEYRKFVYRDTYLESAMRAYLVSFLVTYGYADLRIDPLEGSIHIVPLKERVERPLAGRQMTSIPISLSYDEWIAFKGAEQRG
jgi:hypothetical protein